MQHINFVTQKNINMQEEKHYIDSIYYQLELTAKYCKYLGSQLMQKIGMPLSLDEVVTLDTIASNGEMSQRDLAKLILKDRPSTGRILNSLEKKGFINRVADTKNNRPIKKIALTANGKSVLDKTIKSLKDYLLKIPQVLSYNRIDEITETLRDFRGVLKNEVEINI